ncbi:hypothetical protein C5748_02555 [Phyllobacterium phragmitis]|uniref:Uncharacterized protein n=1 Tax=Phyllobacterium phragmitis TaxID=2670329 RepID=A0A2S9IX70_9HYPH|nr:hypothetical protein [Phyllobacterium phragmitis]PRD45123.1 hypothetical protein C5748_02555 [Phyllobacterium phragmitis]
MTSTKLRELIEAMHFTSDAEQEKRGVVPLFACVLWIAAILFAFHWAVPGENDVDDVLAIAAGNQGDMRSPVPAREQSAPAQNPMRAAALEAWHLKATPLRHDGGQDPALLPASYEFGIWNIGGAIPSRIAAPSTGIFGRAFAARAPPAAA